MSFTKEQKNFGVLKVEGKSVRIHNDSGSFIAIYVGEEIEDARWNGDVINVYLKTGKVRRYKDENSYTIV